jgi:predicted kinase
MKKLVVMSGIPGSGKSTYLSKLQHPPVTVCSADHFFIQEDGSYKFCAPLLNLAHGDCFAKFTHLLEAGCVHLAVDNTNLGWSEAGRYIEAGLAAGYVVELVQLRVPPAAAAARCVHGVPIDKVAALARRQLLIPGKVLCDPNFLHTVIDQ